MVSTQIGPNIERPKGRVGSGSDNEEVGVIPNMNVSKDPLLCEKEQ